MSIEVVVHANGQSLAEAVAARTVASVVARQSAGRLAQVCLTGGRIGTDVLRVMAESPLRESIDWERIHIWWGDERYLAAGDPDRNETQARAALLDLVPIPADNVHPILGPGDTADAEESADAYAMELAAAARAEEHAPVPSFDVLLLSIGPDGHIASLFPEYPALSDDRPVVSVHGSPKPPPTRVTLTFDAINAAREVWILAAGAEKAEAVRLVLVAGAGPLQVPAAGALGRERTLWLLDEEAAQGLPEGLARPGA